MLELGGSDPFILLGTDDLDERRRGRRSRRGSTTPASPATPPSGSSSPTTSTTTFVEKLTAALTAAEPGDPTSDDTAMGPLSSTAAADRLQDQLEARGRPGREAGRRRQREGNFFAPAVLTGVSPGQRRLPRGVLRPGRAACIKVGSEEEAVTLANDTPFGLGSYLFTTDAEQAQRVADRIEAGMVFVNGVGADGAELPFGGVKRSGFGRELGRYGIEEFVNKKLIRVGG